MKFEFLLLHYFKTFNTERLLKFISGSHKLINKHSFDKVQICIAYLHQNSVEEF